MQQMSINGLSIEANGDTIIIKGIGKSSGDKDVVIDKSGVIKGDVSGNIKITGNNVTIVIEGDVEGNIIGNCNITVKGDVEGNIVGGTVRR